MVTPNSTVEQCQWMKDSFIPSKIEIKQIHLFLLPVSFLFFCCIISSISMLLFQYIRFNYSVVSWVLLVPALHGNTNTCVFDKKSIWQRGRQQKYCYHSQIISQPCQVYWANMTNVWIILTKMFTSCRIKPNFASAKLGNVKLLHFGIRKLFYVWQWRRLQYYEAVYYTCIL